MIKSIQISTLSLLLTFIGCDKQNGFDGTNVYLCNFIEGDSIPIRTNYVRRKSIELFKSKPINIVTVQNSNQIDSLILKQHENYNTCDTFNIAELASKCKYVVVIKSTTKMKYKSDEPSEEQTIPIIIPFVLIGSVNVGGETLPPDYHYYNCITGFVYDLSRKREIYVFTKVAISQHEEDTCSTCFKTNVDAIFNELSRDIEQTRNWRKYQKMNHINLKSNF
jgi:hypothetical protein